MRNDTSKTISKSQNRLVRIGLITLGCLSIVLGALGLFLPILPTTPFMLLAAACFVRSSDLFYNKLLGNKLFGVYIKNYLENRGIPMRVKLSAITFLWIGITLSIIFTTELLVIKILLIIIAISVTIHIAKLKTEN